MVITVSRNYQRLTSYEFGPRGNPFMVMIKIRLATCNLRVLAKTLSTVFPEINRAEDTLMTRVLRGIAPLATTTVDRSVNTKYTLLYSLLSCSRHTFKLSIYDKSNDGDFSRIYARWGEVLTINAISINWGNYS